MAIPSQQLTLFDLGVSVAPLFTLCEELMQQHLAPTTHRAYAEGWKRFIQWCAEVGRDPMPATVETVRLCVAGAIQKGHRLATVKLTLSSIRHEYRRAAWSRPWIAVCAI